MKFTKKTSTLLFLVLLATSTTTPILSSATPMPPVPAMTPVSINLATRWNNITGNKSESLIIFSVAFLFGILMSHLHIYYQNRQAAKRLAAPREQDTTVRDLDFSQACPICFEHENDLENTAERIRIPCSHAQHAEPVCYACIEQCREHNPLCPMCREPLKDETPQAPEQAASEAQ